MSTQTGEWTLRPIRLADAPSVARVHRTVIEGFLPSLGEAVLTHVYAASCTAPETVGLVVELGGDVVGFVLGTRDLRRLFRYVIVRRGIGLGWAVLCAFVRRPGHLGRIFETLRFPGRSAPPSTRPPDEAELVAIGVLPLHRNRGLAKALIHRLSLELSRFGVRSYRVATYASNWQADHLYRSLGFEMIDEFEMYGRAWNRYRIELDRATNRAAVPSTPNHSYLP
jgi:ribosomal protein S18 acetylase RimI-like enzyme